VKKTLWLVSNALHSNVETVAIFILLLVGRERAGPAAELSKKGLGPGKPIAEYQDASIIADLSGP
jgi:hypothetical protein